MKYKRKKESDFWQLARRYLHDYMPIIRNLSDKSVEAYKQSLKVYLQFLEEEKGLANEKVDFNAFTRELRRSKKRNILSCICSQQLQLQYLRLLIHRQPSTEEIV